MPNQTISIKRIALTLIIASLVIGNIAQYLLLKDAQSKEYTITFSQVIDLFHQISYQDPNTWMKNTWMGIPTLQNPNDVWIIQETISELKPDFVIEAGTYHGGSAIVWASILSQVNPNGRVITVDIEDHTEEARKVPIFQEKVDFLLGSSTSPEIIDAIRKEIEGAKVVLVILDSLHTKDHVLKEMELYSPLVTPGSYLIVQDTNMHGHPAITECYPGPGPWEAVHDFLKQTDQFKIDKSKERLLFTMHPDGYLKKVK
ncbi:MAG: class I SAM-dependent methyltransferase [Candidatus Aureabacteria bacterium]|nr:class I SAM-dependent methyltransferase [Candidatus Auribacterota bacterium]